MQQPLYGLIGGKLGQIVGAFFMFTQKGVIVVDLEDKDPDELMMDALDAGADDFDAGEDAIDTAKVDKVVRSKEHVALAKAVADESIVLLENKDNILPLDLSRFKSIALLGPNSNYGVAGDYG